MIPRKNKYFMFNEEKKKQVVRSKIDSLTKLGMRSGIRKTYHVHLDL